MSTTTAQAALSTADKARRKAEARRLRIMAKSAERLNVVNGLAPNPKSSSADDEVAVSSPTAAAVVSPVASVSSTGDNDAAVAVAAESREPVEDGKNNSNETAGAAATDPSEPVESSKGSRRMAAMRRRRYQSKNKQPPKEETTPAAGGAGEAASPSTAKEGTKTEAEKVETKAVEKSEPALVKEKAPEATPTTTDPEEDAKTTKIKDDKENEPPAAPKATTQDETTTKKENDSSDEPQKKYRGVARMRRLRLKEQKAQRLKEINDAEVLGSANHSRSNSDMERELAAEMVTMGITASAVRRGGSAVDESRVNLSSVMMGKKTKNKWWWKFVPPMKLVPRMVTLLLLFVAGLDLGTQPHFRGGASDYLATRDLAGVASNGVRNLIQHVEPSITKPWEYGMGGKVAFAVGMAPSSPPTALPTSFYDDMVCAGGDFDATAGECMAPKDNKSNSDTKSGKKEKQPKKNKVIVGQLMEDKLDTSRTRPKGVVTIDDEFATDTVNKAPNIDPLFQVDLDDLLTNAQLPSPIKVVAKLAIGLHRTWVYYLWTLPTSIVKSVLNGPKALFSGWITNPPWILGTVLFIRLMIKILVGNGKQPFDLTDDKNDSSSGKSDDSGGSGGFDVLGKLTDTAKGYATSTYPKTFLFFSTLWKVMKVDMYVVLCGMLIGLVGPLAREDYLEFSRSGGGGGSSMPVLGDGEL